MKTVQVYKFGAVIFVFLLSLGELISQTPVPINNEEVESYYWRSYTSEQGLLQNTVRDLVYDVHGFLWIANEKGISRFDGENFRNYYGLPLSHVNARVYNLLDMKDSILIKGRPNHLIKNGSLLYDPDLNLPDSLIKPNFNINYSISNNYQGKGKLEMAAFPTKERAYYLIAKVGEEIVGLSHIQDGIESPLSLPPFILNEDLEVDIKNAFVLNNEFYWLYGNQLFRYNPEGLIKDYRLPFDRFDFCTSSDGEEVYFLFEGSLYSLGMDSTNRPQLQFLMKNEELKSLNVLVHDETYNNFAIGTATKGLFLARKNIFSYLKPDVPENLTNIRSAREIGKDSILFNTGILTLGENDHQDIPSLKFDRLFYSQNALYNGHHLLKYQIDQDFQERAILSSIDDLRISNFIKDSEGRIWAGEKGLYYIKGDSLVEKISHFGNDQSGHYTLFYNPISNEICSAGMEGVYVYSIEKDSIVNHVKLPFRFVNNIFFSSENIAWFNSRGEGMFAYWEDSLYKLPNDPNNYLQYSHSILEDDSNFFWISSDNGLFKVKKSELIYGIQHPNFPVYFYYYDKNWGFLNNEFNSLGHPANLKLSNGKFGFPSFAGLVTFDPNEVFEEQHGNQIFIDRIRINDRDTILESNPHLDQSSLDIDFKIIHAFNGHSNNVYMQYKLDGYHSDWIRFPEGDNIHFSKLPHGSYVLRVRKKSGFGTENFARLAYPFVIKKQLHEESWFRVGVLLILILIILGIFFLRSQLAKRKRIELEHIIKDKTEDYRVLNERLKLNLAQLRSYQMEQERNTKTKDRMVGIYVHDIRGPLRFIMTVASKSIQAQKDLDAEDISYSFKSIHDSTEGVFKLTEKIFGWTQANESNFELQLRKIKIQKLMNELIQQFTAQAEVKKVRFKNRIKVNAQILSEENLLIIIINNLFQNAIKYTEEGDIVIEAEEITDYTVLTVSDNGIGIDSRRLEQLNDGQYESTPGTANEIGKGFGLKVIKDFMKQLGGYMQIESTFGKGTSVKLFFRNKESN